jgi:hypothetical protein
VRRIAVSRIGAGVGVALVLVVVAAVIWQSRASEQPRQAAGSGSAPAGPVARTEPAGVPAVEPAGMPAVEPAGVPATEPLFVAGGSGDASAVWQEGAGVWPREGEGVSSSVGEGALSPVGEEVGPGLSEEDGDAGEGPRPADLEAVSGESYTWHDGDRALVVRPLPGWVLRPEDEGGDDDVYGYGVVPVGDARRERRGVSAAAESVGALPVFVSDEGELMALPGGVVVVLDPGWDGAAVDGFFERNGVAAGRVTVLDYVANGFFVETEPGFASLDLANALVGQAGVELSSPNWWRESVTE